MTSPIISIYVGVDLKSRFSHHCKRNGVKVSNALRDVMVFLLSKENGASMSSVVVADVPEDGKSKRVEIRLKPAKLKELQYRAQLQGFSPNRLITGLLDVHLAKTPTPLFGQYELDALTASTSQLLKLGTNLNQIARAINKNPLETDLARVELIEEIRQQINSHTRDVGSLIEANLKRWSVK